MDQTNSPNGPSSISPLLLLALGLGAAVLSVIAYGLRPIFFAEPPADTAGQLGVIAIHVTGASLGFVSLALLIIGAIRQANGAASTDAGQTELLRAINQKLMLSDSAKRTVYRQQELQFLRDAIQQRLQAADYESARSLSEELATNFGYREEAEQLKEQIAVARTEQTETKVRQAVARLDEMLQRRDFGAATLEAAKLQRLYPESSQTHHLQRRVGQSRQRYKLELERAFLQAAEREDIDRAMELMAELDKYLTEEEAAPFLETARGVIGKKRDNLGVRFKMAVADREWLQAVRVGEQLISEFPNSRMAEEARGMIDLLRERAAGQRMAQSAAESQAVPPPPPPVPPSA